MPAAGTANDVFTSGPAGSPIQQNALCPGYSPPSGGIGLDARGTDQPRDKCTLGGERAPGLLIARLHRVTGVRAGVNTSGGQYGGGFYWTGARLQVSDSTTSTGASESERPEPRVSARMRHPIRVISGTLVVRFDRTRGSRGARPNLRDFPETVAGSLAGYAAIGRCSFGETLPSGVCAFPQRSMGSSWTDQARLPRIPVPGTSERRAANRRTKTRTTQSIRPRLDPLTAHGQDAAGHIATGRRHVIDVDNIAPTVSDARPDRRPGNRRPRSVTANATAGPSGVYGIDCSVDRGPSAAPRPSASAQSQCPQPPASTP